MGTAQGDAEITGLLIKWSSGEKAALNELIPLVHVHLHRIAQSYLRHERDNHTLQPTALVNEAYLQLIDQKTSSFENRIQFFGLAAGIMRNILVDYARARTAEKRGGRAQQLSLGNIADLCDKQESDLIAIDDALNSLSKIYPEHANIVELRFFGGLTIEETAEALCSSHATVERQWNFARAWLRRELGR
ncbi:MAG TPA: sigma-70 family RNA polymerase sigma factor [Blastocatellia bacterium]|nr:sigma-70 family RNA polymerase sigma factor [Blastocatellia bacterium]